MFTLARPAPDRIRSGLSRHLKGLLMSETGRAETREISVMGRLSAAIAAIGVLCLAMAAMFAPAAGAETFGQIGSPFGSAGTGNGQFLSPGAFGVDPVDGSVYGGDVTSN